VGKLAHLADIFCHLSKLNTGVLHNYICTRTRQAFKKKLVLWDGCVQKGNTEMFTTSNDFLTSVDVSAEELFDIISQNL